MAARTIRACERVTRRSRQRSIGSCRRTGRWRRMHSRFPCEVGCERAWSVGSKYAQLGEMKSQLGFRRPKVSRSAPGPTSISSTPTTCRPGSANASIRWTSSVGDLQRVSEEIRTMVLSSQVPEDLAEDIRRRYGELKDRVPSAGVALRSSAIGEDTLFSFAGQYESFLNVGPDDLIDRYRDVLVSKFTPQAIYYYLSHSLSEADLAMAVGCVTMVDASSSGVIYTRDPVLPGGRLARDLQHLRPRQIPGGRHPDAGRLPGITGGPSGGGGGDPEKACQAGRLRGRGTVEAPVPEAEQRLPSLSEDQVKNWRSLR